jgi:hypothetical protein
MGRYAMYEVNITHPKYAHEYIYHDTRDHIFEYKTPRFQIGDEVLF